MIVAESNSKMKEKDDSKKGCSFHSSTVAHQRQLITLLDPLIVRQILKLYHLYHVCIISIEAFDCFWKMYIA